MNKALILVVEDDKPIRNLIVTALEMQGYRYRTAENGSESIIEAISCKPDIIILDLGLPDMDGVDIIKKIRTWAGTPIIVVSARSEDSDKVSALDAGADDYMTKPFSVDELLARVRVTLRHAATVAAGEGVPSSVFENGGLTIDYAAGCAFLDGEEIHLTPMEYKLLCLLSRNVGKVLTHHTILKEVWVNATVDDTPSLRVFMATLRKKLEGDGTSTKYIQTHIGVGYRMIKV